MIAGNEIKQNREKPQEPRLNTQDQNNSAMAHSPQKIRLIILLAACIAGNAEAKSKDNSKSVAHKQIELIDPQDTETWVSQFNLETDRYQNTDYLYTSITTTSHNWSLQIGAQNAPLSPGDPTVPLAYAGISKQIDITPVFNITLSSQIGSYTNAFSFLNFDYATFGVNTSDYTLAIGPYYVNKPLSETVNKIDYIVFWNYNWQSFTINGSYISGDNAMSGLAANLGYNINRYLQPYIGFGDVAPNLSCQQCSQYYYLALGFNLNL
jgi:hypothetical protein